MNSAGYKNAADQRENQPGGMADTRREIIGAVMRTLDSEEPVPKMVATYVMAFRDFAAQLRKDADDFEKEKMAATLVAETRQRADKLDKLADEIECGEGRAILRWKANDTWQIERAKP